MAVKALLANLDEVEEGLRPHYKKVGEKFALDVNGLDDHPDLTTLRTAKQHEKDDRVAAENKAKELQKKLDELEAEFREKLKGTVGKDELARLERSYEQQVKDLTAAAGKGSEALKVRDDAIRSLTVDNAALTLATELAKDETSIPVFLPHIVKRLGVELVDGKAVTKVLDADGKPTDKALAQLREEFVANAAFSSIVKGSKATGGGATGGTGGGGAPLTGKKASELSPGDLAARVAAKRKAKGK